MDEHPHRWRGQGITFRNSRPICRPHSGARFRLACILTEQSALSSAEQLLSGLAPQAAVRSAHRWTYVGTALGLLIALGLGGYFAVNGDMIGFEWLRAFEAKDRLDPLPTNLRPLLGASGSDRGPIRRDQRRCAQQKAAEEAAQQIGAAEGRGGSGAEAGAAEGGGGSGAEAGAAEGGGGSGAEVGAAEGGGGGGAAAGAAEGGGGSGAEAVATTAGAAGARSRHRIRLVQSQIAEAQRLLTSMGLSPGAANGKMGPRTQEMVRAFQSIMGLPPTGELTMALLETLRGTAPPVAARAKSLFTLAAEARNARRFGDATRLYEAALKLAPNDADGLLALGDLRRDANDLEAARRAYETLASGHGAAAGIARRAARRPAQAATAVKRADDTDDAASQAAHTPSGSSRPTAPAVIRISAGWQRRRRTSIRHDRSMAPIPECVS